MGERGTVTVYEVALRMPARPGARVLTFDEVVLSGRPAIFAEFGDLLAYLDGTVFILQGVDVFAQPEASPLILDPRSVVRAVGIESGWHHERACDCSVCARHLHAA